MGYRTVLVLSGETKMSDLANFAYRPDLVVNSVKDLIGRDSPLAFETLK
jgi:ribonucleotide monophosphatase NagD (HAD superfamily)